MKNLIVLFIAFFFISFASSCNFDDDPLEGVEEVQEVECVQEMSVGVPTESYQLGPNQLIVDYLVDPKLDHEYSCEKVTITVVIELWGNGVSYLDFAEYSELKPYSPEVGEPFDGDFIYQITTADAKTLRFVLDNAFGNGFTITIYKGYTKHLDKFLHRG